MKRGLLLIVCLLMGWMSALAQHPYQKGFDYLNDGNFVEAKTFFDSIVQLFPNDKTARICQGRATGLTGETAKAVQIFADLQKQYPGDVEVLLNVAEAEMWSKRYANALKYYQDLLKADPKLFGAQLGEANALSNLKRYKEAVEAINRALTLQPGNQSAMISQKYILLGRSGEHRNAQDYQSALKILQRLDELYPNDIDVILNRINLFLISEWYGKADKELNRLKSDSNRRFYMLTTKAYTSFLLGSISKSKRLAQEAVEVGTKQNVSPKEMLLFQINSSGWVKAYDQAFGYLEKYRTAFPMDTLMAELINARLLLWKGRYAESHSSYAELIAKDSSFKDAQIGMIEVLFARGLDEEAINKTVEMRNQDSTNLTLINFYNRIRNNHTSTFDNKTFYSTDNGGNNAINSVLNAGVSMSMKWRWNLMAHYRNAYFEVDTTEVNINRVYTGVSYKPSGKFNIQAQLGLIHLNDGNSLGLNIESTIKPSSKELFILRVKSDFQDYGVGLIEAQIRNTDYFLEHNIALYKGLGWYTQLVRTQQSDENSRNLAFTSLYYTIRTTPIWKTGLNWTGLSFDEQNPAIYFSPNRFTSTELFMEVQNIDIPRDKWMYRLFFAVGQQKIESNEAQGIYRFETRFGRRFNKWSSFSIYFNRSNAASSSGVLNPKAGVNYQYNEAGFKLNMSTSHLIPRLNKRYPRIN